MPRPPLKRAKLNHPTPANRVAKPSKVSPVVELQQKLANKPIGRVLTDSDDSDKLVTSIRNGRNRRGIPRKDIYASGGVGPGDVPGIHMSQGNQSQASPRFDTQESVGKEKPAAAQKQGKIGGAAKPAMNKQPQVAQRRNTPIQSSPSAPGSTAVSRAPNRLQDTPAPESSILGTIKPRRRQPSILQLIENNDSSNIDDEDEDVFLPNDESTPLNHSTAQGTTSTPHSSLSHPSTARKRKLTPPITLVPASQGREQPPRQNRSQNGDTTNEPDSEPELPPPSRTVIAPLRVTPEPDDPDIMAPPLSSSPLKSPTKSTIPTPIKKASGKRKKQPPAPSTSELRALMPTRRQRKGRLRTRHVSEFDIPADTNSDNSDTGAGNETRSDDDLSFRAASRGRNSKAAAQRKAQPGQKSSNARIRRREKSTISPIKLVTPLKGPIAPKSAAKSSLPQQPGSATTTAKETATYSSRRRDISGNKENRPVDLSGDFSGGEESPEDDSLEQSIEEAAIPVTKEMERFAKKFADVDEWEMEFEEVSLGGNSSPNRR